MNHSLGLNVNVTRISFTTSSNIIRSASYFADYGSSFFYLVTQQNSITTWTLSSQAKVERGKAVQAVINLR